MSKISYGKKDVLKPSDFDPANAKERISIWISEDVVNAFRERASQEGTKYQSLMNQALREWIEKPSLAERVERIEKRLDLKTG
jgi:uncharacterized protein (DUF4415 family)